MRKTLYLFSKRVIDIAVSLAVLAVMSPVLAVVALCVKLTSPGPVIHKRKCVGKNGFYYMYKFRTMYNDADNFRKYLTPAQIEEYRRNIKVINDPRITKIGKYLRRLSLDEFPQLWNVLKGEMSLVGPRPLAEEEVYIYGDQVDKVLSVKPGVTGYWQTHGRSGATYDSGKRQELEMYYVENQSFILDVKILMHTCVILLRGGVMLCSREISRGIVYHLLKFLVDEISSAFLLALLSPLFVIVAVAIKLDDGGDVLHRRKCVGKNGKEFIMYKFRSMCMDADNYEKYFSGEELERYLRGEKNRNDPRLTRAGKFMRRTSIDELPQLISVLMGNMSLVGPRPVTAREADFYGDMKPYLLSIRPGITGWWQVNGRDNVAYLSGKAKSLQLYYVFNQCIILDVKILLKTIIVVLRKDGAK